MAVAALSAVERIRKKEEEKRIKCNKRKQEWYQRKKEMNAKNKETKPMTTLPTITYLKQYPHRKF
jgi:hypothetical protein